MPDKNFRLDPAIRPTRYDANLALDLEKRRFSGRMRIELALHKPTREIVLHAIDLDVRSPQAARITPHAESETITIELAQPLEGNAAIDLEWTGPFSQGLRGLYAAGPVAVTQFEAADARRVFPSFDEPAFKARWAITLEVPGGKTVLSNGAPVEQSGARTRFAETPPLPTYLIALATGPLEPSSSVAVRGVPVRTFAVPAKKHLTAFAQEVAQAVLPRLEDYFGLPYAFGKVDQVAVPDFEAGAMENAGLITFRETALLLDPATASLATKKRVAEVITHELAHQWFGNWVTMAWWDDLWLNEAFATWMAFKIVDGWRPEWRMWIEFDGGKAAALHLDALDSTHPIRAEVKNAHEAGENFDVITYEKGGAVLRMIEGYLGEAPFRDGIRAYMREHAQANATADDLWRALGQASGEPVPELANQWIGQPGYPLVNVRVDGARVHLSQHRFRVDPTGGGSPPSHRAKPDGAPPPTAPGAKPGDAVWPVPLVLRWDGGERRHLLRAREATIDLERAPAWLCANAGATGFYRVAYDADALARLGKHLGDLAPAERIQLVADEWALVRAGVRSPTDFLDLLAGFGGETDHAVLDEVVGRFATVEHRLVADADRPKLAAFIDKLWSPALQKLGWDAAAGEADEVRLRRSALVRAIGGVARSAAVATEARKRLDRYFSGDTSAIEPNLHDAVITLAARRGDAALFDQLLTRFRSETDPMFKRRFLFGLTAFEDAALAARARELALTDTVPLQDLSGYVTMLLANRTAREDTWRLLHERWRDFAARTSGAPTILRRIIEGLGQLVERRHLTEAEELLGRIRTDDTQQTIAQTLERLRLDVDLRERTQGPIGTWLTARK